MEPDERRRRISALHHAALERSPVERDAFLKAECQGDEALRQEVESLLQYESQSVRFLETPAALVAAGAAGGTPGGTSMVGHTLGPYTIVSPLGVGGMGEVYRARDSKLGRDVAIKVLPSHFTADAERRARFAREARLLATLNHPHIGAIYGLEEADGFTGLVLELVEGTTLADRLERGRLPMPQALTIARQIADALDAAHQKGIVHRDLKPANVVLQGTDDGLSSDARAKVLDFGLAKTIEVGREGELANPTASSFDGTADGRILGTPAYMSPEQARGLAVDKRTDIWAFACVLFEMLSGHRPFEGETVTDTVARILEREPDWTVLPAKTPAPIRTLLQRCLRKEPHERLHDIADARIELDEIDLARNSSGDLAPPPASPVRTRRAPLPWIIGALLLVAGLAGAAGFLLRGRAEPEPGPYIEFPYHPAEYAAATFSFLSFALSPDGRYLAFIASAGQGSAVWVRPLDTITAQPIPGTEGATHVFWKPDSRQIGFFAKGGLEIIPLSGGAAREVSPAEAGVNLAGAAWNHADVIVFSSKPGPLEKVSAKGGTATAVTRLEEGDVRHAWPNFLPDGHHFVYLAQRRDGGQLRVGSLDGVSAVHLVGAESSAIYASGHLLFQTAGNLVAQRFDTSARQLLGEPIMLVQGDFSTRTGGALPGITSMTVFSASTTGVLAYYSGTLAWQLTWRDRSGMPFATVGEPGFFSNVDLSPDEERLAVSASARDRRSTDIWLFDLVRGDGHPLITNPAQEFDPAWSSDGSQVSFNSNRSGRWQHFRRAADGTGEDVLLADGGGAADWSPNGNHLLYWHAGDLWWRPTSGDAKPFPFRQTQESNESQGTFSPDGQWIAYRSTDASGRAKIYVSPFPSGRIAHKISPDGGHAPRWNGDGSELYFLSRDATMMVASIGKPMDFTRPPVRELFPTDLRLTRANPYAVTKDGQRFLMPVPIDSRNMYRITVAVNWTSKLPN